MMADNDYGYTISAVRMGDGRDLPRTIVGTLMRVDLPAPLAPGESAEFAIEWAFNIVEEDAVVARSGFSAECGQADNCSERKPIRSANAAISGV